MHELLLPESLARAEAVARCDRYLATRIRRWRLARAFLPQDGRDDWIAVLAWQRLGRELAAAPGGFERRRHLEELASELDHALSERARSPVGTALSFVLRRHELPEELLRRTILEWKRDEELATFETREALLAHARALAIPEGRVLLRLAGAATARNEALADALAVALQLSDWTAGFEDELARGRLRIPVDELVRGGVELGRLESREAAPALARVVGAQLAWARTFYARGWELCRELGPWGGRRLAFVLRWHAAALSALEARRNDVRRGAPPSGWLRLVACAGASAATTGAPRFG